jgi:hypothetical protein
LRYSPNKAGYVFLKARSPYLEIKLPDAPRTTMQQFSGESGKMGVIVKIWRGRVIRKGR